MVLRLFGRMEPYRPQAQRAPALVEVTLVNVSADGAARRHRAQRTQRVWRVLCAVVAMLLVFLVRAGAGDVLVVLGFCGALRVIGRGVDPPDFRQGPVSPDGQY